jgi:hypothetical protein
MYGKPVFTVPLEMRVDSKHQNVGFLALSGRSTVTSLTTAHSQKRKSVTNLQGKALDKASSTTSSEDPILSLPVKKRFSHIVGWLGLLTGGPGP